MIITEVCETGTEIADSESEFQALACSRLPLMRSI